MIFQLTRGLFPHPHFQTVLFDSNQYNYLGLLPETPGLVSKSFPVFIRTVEVCSVNPALNETSFFCTFKSISLKITMTDDCSFLPLLLLGDLAGSLPFVPPDPLSALPHPALAPEANSTDYTKRSPWPLTPVSIASEKLQQRRR